MLLWNLEEFMWPLFLVDRHFEPPGKNPSPLLRRRRPAAAMGPLIRIIIEVLSKNSV